MSLADILHRPSENEMAEAVELMRISLAEKDLKLPYSLTAKWVLIPPKFLPENAWGIHPRTAKLALDEMRKHGEITRYRRRKEYKHMTEFDELIYTTKPFVYSRPGKEGAWKGLLQKVMGLNMFRQPSENELREAGYLLLNAIDAHTLFIPHRKFWERDSWLPTEVCDLDERAAKLAFDKMLKQGYISFIAGYHGRNYSITENGRTYLELESTSRIGISELEKKFG